MIWKTGSSPDPLTPDPKMAAKDDSMRSMRVVFGREYGPVRCYSSIFVAFLCGERKLFQMSRCFTKMSRWFGLGILIEFCKWKGNHTCEDAQNLICAPLITTTKHFLSYGNLALFFVVAHQLITGVWWLESIDTLPETSSSFLKQMVAPEGSRIVFQPSIFGGNSLLVSGRVIIMNYI